MGVLWAATSSGFRPTKRIAATLGSACLHAVDNGAFGCWQSGYWWDAWAWLRTISDVQRAGIRPRWIIAPDIVAGGESSLIQSLSWMDHVPGAPWAIAVQNGMAVDRINSLVCNTSHTVSCLFVGGSVDWKWQTAPSWIALASDLSTRLGRKIECHIGRCGSLYDLERAGRLGANSCDSSSFVRNKSWDIVRSHAAGVMPDDMFTIGANP